MVYQNCDIMKRLLSLLSLLMISISLFAVEFVVDGIKYSETSSKTVKVVSNNYSGDIVIPDIVVNNNIIMWYMIFII